MFARELAKRELTDTEKPILAMSVHPGTVDTDAQGAWTESYGVLGKILEFGSRLFAKSSPEGAEASLWAATSSDISKSNWKDYQVRNIVFWRTMVLMTVCFYIRVTTTRSRTAHRTQKLRKPKTPSSPTAIGISR